MNKSQARAVSEYVGVVWQALGLTALNVDLSIVGGEEDFLGRVEVLRNVDVALELHEAAFERRELLREVVVHEGCHVMLDRMTTPVEVMLIQAKQEAARDVVIELEEQVVTRLARLLAPLVPLPNASLVRSVSRSMDKRKNTAKKGRGSG